MRDGGRDARWLGRSRSAGLAGVLGEVTVWGAAPGGAGPVRVEVSGRREGGGVRGLARPSVRAVGRGGGCGQRAVSALAWPSAAASGSEDLSAPSLTLAGKHAQRFISPKPLFSLISKPTCIYKGNLIGLFLILSHLTHQNAIWREREQTEDAPGVCVPKACSGLAKRGPSAGDARGPWPASLRGGEGPLQPAGSLIPAGLRAQTLRPRDGPGLTGPQLAKRSGPRPTWRLGSLTSGPRPPPETRKGRGDHSAQREARR